MPNIPVIPAKDFLRWLLKYGCVYISTQGSHFKIEYPETGERSTIPIHGGKDLGKVFFKKNIIAAWN